MRLVPTAEKSPAFRRGVSLNQLAEMLRHRLSRPVATSYRPRRNCDVLENVLDVTRAMRELLWAAATTLEAGLERLIRAAQARLMARA
jgi:nucleoside-diphosphate-sugar epimerase